MRTISIASSFLLIVFLAGCSSNPSSPSNNGNNSSSADTTSYLPLSTGSSWTYSGSAGTYTVTILGDTLSNGFTWKIISNSGSAGHGYMRKSGSQYLATALPGYIIPGVVISLDETPNSTWIWDLSPQPGLTAHYVYKNSQQGLTRTVLSKTFTNVIDVRMDYTFAANGVTYATGTYHYYYAKGIGLIDSDLSAQGDQPLVSYSIK